MCVFVYMCFCVLFNLSCKAHQRPLCSRQGPLCSVWNILTYRTPCHVFYFDDVSLGQESLSFALLFFYFINVLCAEKPSAGADNRCYLCTWKDNSISQFIIQLAFTRCSTFVPVLPHKVNLLLLANHTYYSRNLYLIINF